jgi:hypothetical protein
LTIVDALRNRIAAAAAEEVMSTQTLNPTAYRKLLAKVLPQAIKDEREYDRLVAEAGRLTEVGGGRTSRGKRLHSWR